MRSMTLGVLRQNRRMKGRVIGIALLMAMATGMFILGFYDADSLEYSVDMQLETSKFPDYFVSFSDMENETDLTTIMDAHLASGNVSAYQLRVTVDGFYYYDGQRYPAQFVGVADPDQQDINIFNLESGSYFTGSGEAMAVTGMEAEGLVVGAAAEFTILGTNVTLDITGLGMSTEHLGTGSLSLGGLSIPGGVAIIFMPISDLQAIFGGGVNSLIFLSEDSEPVLDSLSTLSVSQVMLGEEMPALIMLDMGVKELRNVMPVMSLLFLVVGLVAITMIFSRMIENDSRLIGVLMSMGYRNGEIIKSYMSFGLLMAAASSLLGIVFGYFISLQMLEIYKVFLANIEMYPASTVMPFIMAVAVNFAAVILAMVVPLLRIRNRSVKESLEHRKDDRMHVSRLTLPVSKMSLMGLRNTFRVPRQTISTIIVVGLAVGVAGSWVVLGDSALGYMSDQLDSEQWDMEIDFVVPIDSANITETGLGMPANSTTAVIPFLTLAGSAEWENSTSETLLLGSTDLTTIRDFSVLQGEINTSGFIISNLLADDLGIEIGDLLTVSVGTYTLNLTVTTIIDDMMGMTIYTNMSNLPYSGLANGAHIILAEGTSASDVSDSLYDNPLVTSVIIKDTYIQEMADLIDMSVSMFYAFFMLNGMITFIIAGASVTIIAAERELEYATLKSMGIRDGELRKSVFIEMSLLSIGSVLVGLPSAYLFSVLLGKIYEEMVFYFPITMTLQDIALIVGLGIIFIMASSTVPMRVAKKVEVEKVIRERVSG